MSLNFIDKSIIADFEAVRDYMLESEVKDLRETAQENQTELTEQIIQSGRLSEADFEDSYAEINIMNAFTDAGSDHIVCCMERCMCVIEKIRNELINSGEYE